MLVNKVAAKLTRWKVSTTEFWEETYSLFSV